MHLQIDKKLTKPMESAKAAPRSFVNVSLDISLIPGEFSLLRRERSLRWTGTGILWCCIARGWLSTLGADTGRWSYFATRRSVFLAGRRRSWRFASGWELASQPNGWAEALTGVVIHYTSNISSPRCREIQSGPFVDLDAKEWYIE